MVIQLFVFIVGGKTMVNKPTFALALGGGGARGIAHIHVLEVLDEMGIKPVVVSGSSIGAIMGAAYASGMTGCDIRDYIMDLMTNRVDVVRRLWKARGSTNARFKFFPLDIERVTQAFLPATLPAQFDGLSLPLIVTAVDFYTQKVSYITNGDLNSAISASCAIPGLFQSVRRHELTFVDGGLCDPVPFESLKNKADYVIAVDVVGAPQNADNTKPSMMESLFGASQLMMQTIISLKLDTYQPDIMLRPYVHEYRVLDFLKARDILESSEPIRGELRVQIEAILISHGVQ
jgi:NTE family protein